MEGWHVQRMRLAHVAVAATMTPAVIACDATEGVGGVTVHRAGSATTDPTGSSGRSQAEPTDQWLGRGLFSVEADQAEYWRMLTLDRFDGASWTRSHPDDEGVLLAVPAALPQPGGSSPPRSEMLNQTFRILGDTNILTALPMAQAAEEIAGPLGHITWDTERSQALPQGRLQPGMEYTVRSRIAVPTSEELDQVEWVPDAYEQWTELPAGLDPRITAIAEQWTTHSSSNYQKVLAIQQHFHDGSFAYSTDVAPGIDLVEFLTETKTGYCEQYAAAIAVMVRTLGLPARIAIGFFPGTRQEDGSYLGQAEDAHSWVEVFFPGYGWLPFEPEPGTAHPNAKPGTT